MKTNFSNIYNNFKEVVSNSTASGNLIKVKSLYFTNKSTEAIKLTVVLLGQESSVYLAKDISIDANKSLSLFSSKDLGLFLGEGQSIYVKSEKNSDGLGSSTSAFVPENLADVICSYEIENSSQVSNLTNSTFNEFLEMKVASSSSSFETFVVLIKDPQLSAQIAIESNKPIQNLSDVGDNSESILCGKVYYGAKQYNMPWNFYIDSESVRIKNKNNSLLLLKPSEINDAIGNTLQNGSECCFLLRDLTRVMKIDGLDYCESPLYLDAVKVFDEDLGEFVKETSCQGDCANISGSYCLDLELQNFDSNIDDMLVAAESRVDLMSYEEITTDFFENLNYRLEGIDGDLDYVPSLEELEQNLLEKLYQSSSSSSSSEYFPPISFDHEFNSISTNSTNPSEFILEEGSNLFSSKTGGFYSDSYYRFTVPVGKELLEVRTIIWDAEVGESSIKIQYGSQWGDQPNLVSAEFGANIDAGLFEEALPFQDGQYSMRISSLNYEEIEYVLIFIVQQIEA